tara:strand:+ start:241 stop:414 length:174 start_codon:yes stop_codon:yes gene_type:complete
MMFPQKVRSRTLGSILLREQGQHKHYASIPVFGIPGGKGGFSPCLAGGKLFTDEEKK